MRHQDKANASIHLSSEPPCEAHRTTNIGWVTALLDASSVERAVAITAWVGRVERSIVGLQLVGRRCVVCIVFMLSGSPG